MRNLMSQRDTFENELKIPFLSVVQSQDGFQDVASGQLIHPQAGDIYFCADAYWSMGMLERYPVLKRNGVRIVTLVHDVIPLSHPQFVSKEVEKEIQSAVTTAVENSHHLVCISDASRRDLLDFLVASQAKALCPAPKVVLLAPAIQEFPVLDQEAAAILKDLPDFVLMVGTVEPRRNYLPVLREMQSLWSEGSKLGLVICGKNGDRAEEIFEQFEISKQKEQPLFYFPWASESLLGGLYRKAQAVICASSAEGFGMSVAEGLLFNGRVLANDLPVFREFAGTAPYYFRVEERGSLAELLKNLDQLKKRTHEFRSWTQVARELARELKPQLDNRLPLSEGLV